MERAVAECEAEEAIREGLARRAESERRWMRAAAEAERAALEAERAAPLLQSETEGDMPRDDSDLAPDPDLALPGYTPGWRHSMPSSPLSSPSVSVFGPGLGHQRDWGWDPGGVRAAGGGLGWDPGGGASGKRSAAVCGGVCAVGKGSLVGPPEV